MDAAGSDDADVWESAAKGCLSELRLALSRTGASVDVVNAQGIPLLVFVCLQGHTACARFLIKRHAALEHREPIHGGTALHHAVGIGKTGCAEALVGARASLNALAEDGTTPLIMASLKNHSASVKLLLQVGADTEITMNGRTALEWAVTHHNTESARLIRAHQQRCGTCVRAPSVAEASQEIEDSELCAAAASGNHTLVLELLDGGSHATSTGRGSHPALHFAAASGHTAVCQLLIDRGAPVDQLDRAGGRSALMQACAFRHIDCVHLLIASRAEVCLASWNGIGALHRASASGCVECIELLLQAGVGPDGAKAKANSGKANSVKDKSAREVPEHAAAGSDASPLQLACLHGHTECAKKLINAGAPLSFTLSGKTALDLARKAEHAGCTALLEEAAALRANSAASMLLQDRCETRAPPKRHRRRAKAISSVPSAPHAPETMPSALPVASLVVSDYAPKGGAGIRGETPVVACSTIARVKRPDDGNLTDKVGTTCATAAMIINTDSDAIEEGASATIGRQDTLNYVYGALLCPINLELMHDPVCTCDGHSYERVGIEQWLLTHNTSPMTGKQLENKTLVPNLALRSQVCAVQASVF